jgi:hypothetical protein
LRRKSPNFLMQGKIPQWVYLFVLYDVSRCS